MRTSVGETPVDDLAGWRVSRKGNRWQNWKGLSLTIFQRPADGRFGWCVADEEGPKFGPRTYPSEQAALTSLLRELDGRGYEV